jgi:hypothetical protein
MNGTAKACHRCQTRLWPRLVEVHATMGTSLWSPFSKAPRAEGSHTLQTFQGYVDIQPDKKCNAPSNRQNECCSPGTGPRKRHHQQRQTANAQRESQPHAALDSLSDGLTDRRPGGQGYCATGHCRPDQSVKEARHRPWEATGEVVTDSHHHAPRCYRSRLFGAIL